MIYELEAYNTENSDDIRYREYTSSKKKAELFKLIPKIQFTDSGHGIVFWSREHSGKRKSEKRMLRDYFRKHLTLLRKIK